MDDDERYGANIARLRGGRPQGWLAGEMKTRGHRWTQATVSAVERGAQPLRLREAVDLAQILAPQLPIATVIGDVIVGSGADFHALSHTLASGQLAASESVLRDAISELAERLQSIRAIRLAYDQEGTDGEHSETP